MFAFGFYLTSPLLWSYTKLFSSSKSKLVGIVGCPFCRTANGT